LHVQSDPHDICVECHPGRRHHQSFDLLQLINRVDPGLLSIGPVTLGLAVPRLLRSRILLKSLQHFLEDGVQGIYVLCIGQLLKMNCEPE
jgi:hypothetical protein